ncbi:MAG: hypothetical protein VKQ33_02110 [Candidatus Sericytochromatia bacterium]|nr:hypothetical protein [Candidatus Sericytochromatia bacterium]
MSPDADPAPLTPAAEEAFRQFAASVPDADWDRLVRTTTEAILRRLGACGALDGASPDAMKEAYHLVGELLVAHTNVTLTCLAAARTAADGGA